MPRQGHDPFTSNSSGPLQPTNSNATSLVPPSSLRSQASQHSLRSNTSTASTRLRQPDRGLFAPSLSRRPTSRATPRVEDDVLADSDSEPDLTTHQHRQRQMRRARRGSPESKHGRAKTKQEEEPPMVNRQPDGSFLIGLAQSSEVMAIAQVEWPQNEEEADQEEVDAHYVSIAKQYFASGMALGGRGSKRHEEEYEQVRLPMMIRLREQAMEQLEEERWRYDPLDR